MPVDYEFVRFYLSQIRAYNWANMISNREQGAIDAFSEADERLKQDSRASLDDLQLLHCARLIHTRLRLPAHTMPNVPVFYLVSDAVREQFQQLGQDPSYLDLELDKSSPVGSQKLDIFKRFLPCGLVAVGANSNGSKIITSIETPLQSAAVKPTLRRELLATKVAARQEETAKKRARTPPETICDNAARATAEALEHIARQSAQNALAHIAVRHAIHSTPKTERKDELLDRGIDLMDPLAAEYRVAYGAAKLTVDVLKILFKSMATNDFKLDFAVRAFFDKLGKEPIPLVRYEPEVFEEPTT